MMITKGAVAVLAGFYLFLAENAPAAATFTNLTTLWSFAATNGTAYPFAAVAEASDGMLYGTTYGGATGTDLGGVFKIGKDGSHFFVMHQFVAAEGDTPSAPVIEATNGVLYGTTWVDGPSNGGSIFKINKDGSGFAVLHNFTLATNDGGNSVAGLLQGSDGWLYGTAQYGGIGGGGGNGVVFRIDLNGSNFNVLHAFAPAEGSAPQAALIEGTNGALYGTALDSGISNHGTIFRLDKNGNNFSVVYSFLGGTNGYGPASTLLSAPNGNLYGTTISGGSQNSGVAFILDYSGSNYTVLHQFGALGDGSNPNAVLVTGPDGFLYGTTYFGGGVFAIKPDGSGYELPVSFYTTNGSFANSLIVASDGAIYGTCNDGGMFSQGTVFKVTGQVGLADRIVLNAPAYLGAGGWQVSGRGTANRTYTIQYAIPLAPSITWSNLGPATANTSGNWQLTDPANAPPRFYRARYP